MNRSVQKNPGLPFKPGGVSIVIPARERGRGILACIAAVCSQTEPAREIIVVDNGCDAEARTAIGEFAASHPSVRIVTESVRGRGRARNAGVFAARGEIIAMIDSDCVAPKDWLARLVRPIAEKNESAVMGFETSANDSYWSTWRHKEDARFLYSKVSGKYARHLDTKNFAIRADLMKDFLFDPELTTYEDWEFFLRFSAEGWRIRFLPDLLVRHTHDSSFTELCATQRERGKNLARAVAKHRYNSLMRQALDSDESARSARWRNFLTFLPWMVWRLLRNPRSAPYLIVSDFAWKVGLVQEGLSTLLIRMRSFVARWRFGI